ncbi:HAD family hydrolase [Cognatiyoonia sp. IB215182]|uniref:HAD family hydrolase n=1 Tax=Cognatiyoonia sp. IB215182 TaxID=3097353 RepID=UPI002A141C82|nr:HAD family hydrolase [Cognatiyoonia sp. IB215182]MDX8351015.1 HAD family hydrolase [Cognatiyoonia sp. IB215182]
MIKGLIFDKDGTLFDFNATWGAWTWQMITTETADNPAKGTALAEAMGYDMKNRRFLPGSVVIAATVEETANVMLTVLTDDTQDTLIPRMNAAAGAVEQVQAVPLIPLFDDLRARGLQLGIATNDAAEPALLNLTSAGVRDHFHFIAGYDSGHGAKPGTGQLDAFCRQTGLAPYHCAMIGDSTHDLQAGRAAGMTTIGVLTGPAPAAELAPLADVLLPGIGHIPAWLDAQS